jgi:hypothetical protein
LIDILLMREFSILTWLDSKLEPMRGAEAAVSANAPSAKLLPGALFWLYGSAAREYCSGAG